MKNLLFAVAAMTAALITGPTFAQDDTGRADARETRIERSDGRVIDVISTPEGTRVYENGTELVETADASDIRHAEYVDRWTRDDPGATVASVVTPSRPERPTDVPRHSDPD